jgi:hypothetical protein
MAFFSDEFISFSKRLRQLRCRAGRAALRAGYVGPCPAHFAADSTTKPRRNRFAAPHGPERGRRRGHTPASFQIDSDGVAEKFQRGVYADCGMKDLNIESMIH